ncbi:autoinducer binding domain-containing protein [Mesorhizobium sp.]|uniref:helix-turn-helix transcriptional regulator n=1 Tax=Mesorhizobium sp. TaxID=1871066 RepID=UPI000FE89C46|nr:autoinducer binding domain-containing protein [Mesorhizobium sp.]RWI72174.1 MAG: LuxR family transcriptional regulator [Mesorhizobium sp.]
MAFNERSAQFQRTLLKVQGAATVSDSLGVLQDSYGIDFVTYHLALTVANVVDTPYVRTTYPDAWVSRYLLRGYAKVDPILREGIIRQMPFDWCDVEIPPAAHDFLADAQEHGVGPNGYSIPIVDKFRRALLSLNSRKRPVEWRAIVGRFRVEWIELAHIIHRKAVFEMHGEHDPIPQLGAREIECLHWTALGKDSKDIATILQLSEHTTQTYLKTARYKLGGATISAAIARAIQLRLINPYANPQD